MTSLDLYCPSGVLFRFAIAQRDRAISKSKLVNPSIEDKCRMHDAVLATIILGHAAMESHISWLTVTHNQGKRKWPTEVLESVNQIAILKQRPPAVDYPVNLLPRFQVISAWRNFLQHRDASSLESLQRIVPNPEYESLNVELAIEVIAVVDIFFRFVVETTGTQFIGPSDVLWVNPLELL